MCHGSSVWSLRSQSIGHIDVPELKVKVLDEAHQFSFIKAIGDVRIKKLKEVVEGYVTELSIASIENSARLPRPYAL